jgi:hypothetical protein
MLTVLTQTPLLREGAQRASHARHGLAVSGTGRPQCDGPPASVIRRTGLTHRLMSGSRMSYKRNQIEEAIARISVSNYEKPPSELRTRIKRLLDLDRSMGRKLRSKDPEEGNFGFFSEEAPGTGADISFSEYEAFALLNALRIMGHGWPQGFAVSVMRRVRRNLEREHARILRQNPDKLFNWEEIRTRARPGDIAADNMDPVYLTLASKAQRPTDEIQAPPFSAVCRGYVKVSEFSRDVGGSGVTMFEVVTLAHRLHQELMKTKPRRRGREGGASPASGT